MDLRLAATPSQRRFALAHIIVCCGASIVAHFARKVRATIFAANIANALGHDFVGFLAVLVRHNIRPPHFASKVSYNAAPRSPPQEIRQFVVTLAEAKTEIRCPVRHELRSPVRMPPALYNQCPINP